MRNFQDPNLKEKDVDDIYNRMLSTSKDQKEGVDYHAFLKNSIY